MIALYLVFQIITRSDESEILSHISLPSSIIPSSLSHDPPPDAHQAIPHTWPEHRQSQLTSQLPSPPSTPASNSVWSYVVVGANALVYSFRLIIALAYMPVPYVRRAIALFIAVTTVIFYPATSTINLLVGTFIIWPMRIASSVLSIFKPFLSFLGTVIGVGALMGLVVAWIGQRILRRLLGPRQVRGRRRTKKRSVNGKKATSSKAITVSVGSGRSSDSAGAKDSSVSSKSSYRRGVNQLASAPSDMAGFEEAWEGGSRGTARPPVMGTRRRTHNFGEE